MDTDTATTNVVGPTAATVLGSIDPRARTVASTDERADDVDPISATVASAGPGRSRSPDASWTWASDRYVIERELARGGMGRISIATDRLLDRQVAIKELVRPNDALAARFERERALASRLQHPAIVSIHDAGTWPSGEPFYVMRLVSGESLDRVIARHPTFAERLALLPHAIATVDAIA